MWAPVQGPREANLERIIRSSGHRGLIDFLEGGLYAPGKLGALLLTLKEAGQNDTAVVSCEGASLKQRKRTQLAATKMMAEQDGDGDDDGGDC
jgi:hypothetical protein